MLRRREGARGRFKKYFHSGFMTSGRGFDWPALPADQGAHAGPHEIGEGVPEWSEPGSSFG